MRRTWYGRRYFDFAHLLPEMVLSNLDDFVVSRDNSNDKPQQSLLRLGSCEVEGITAFLPVQDIFKLARSAKQVPVQLKVNVCLMAFHGVDWPVVALLPSAALLRASSSLSSSDAPRDDGRVRYCQERHRGRGVNLFGWRRYDDSSVLDSEEVVAILKQAIPVDWFLRTRTIPIADELTCVCAGGDISIPRRTGDGGGDQDEEKKGASREETHNIKTRCDARMKTKLEGSVNVIDATTGEAKMKQEPGFVEGQSFLRRKEMLLMIPGGAADDYVSSGRLVIPLAPNTLRFLAAKLEFCREPPPMFSSEKLRKVVKTIGEGRHVDEDDDDQDSTRRGSQMITAIDAKQILLTDGEHGKQQRRERLSSGGDGENENDRQHATTTTTTRENCGHSKEGNHSDDETEDDGDEEDWNWRPPLHLRCKSSGGCNREAVNGGDGNADCASDITGFLPEAPFVTDRLESLVVNLNAVDCFSSLHGNIIDRNGGGEHDSSNCRAGEQLATTMDSRQMILISGSAGFASSPSTDHLENKAIESEQRRANMKTKTTSTSTNWVASLIAHLGSPPKVGPPPALNCAPRTQCSKRFRIAVERPREQSACDDQILNLTHAALEPPWICRNQRFPDVPTSGSASGNGDERVENRIQNRAQDEVNSEGRRSSPLSRRLRLQAAQRCSDRVPAVALHDPSGDVSSSAGGRGDSRLCDASSHRCRVYYFPFVNIIPASERKNVISLIEKADEVEFRDLFPTADIVRAAKNQLTAIESGGTLGFDIQKSSASILVKFEGNTIALDRPAHLETANDQLVRSHRTFYPNCRLCRMCNGGACGPCMMGVGFDFVGPLHELRAWVTKFLSRRPRHENSNDDDGDDDDDDDDHDDNLGYFNIHRRLYGGGRRKAADASAESDEEFIFPRLERLVLSPYDVVRQGQSARPFVTSAGDVVCQCDPKNFDIGDEQQEGTRGKNAAVNPKPNPSSSSSSPSSSQALDGSVRQTNPMMTEKCLQLWKWRSGQVLQSLAIGGEPDVLSLWQAMDLPRATPFLKFLQISLPTRPVPLWVGQQQADEQLNTVGALTNGLLPALPRSLEVLRIDFFDQAVYASHIPRIASALERLGLGHCVPNLKTVLLEIDLRRIWTDCLENDYVTKTSRWRFLDEVGRLRKHLISAFPDFVDMLEKMEVFVSHVAHLGIHVLNTLPRSVEQFSFFDAAVRGGYSKQESTHLFFLRSIFCEVIHEHIIDMKKGLHPNSCAKFSLLIGGPPQGFGNSFSGRR